MAVVDVMGSYLKIFQKALLQDKSSVKMEMKKLLKATGVKKVKFSMKTLDVVNQQI